VSSTTVLNWRAHGGERAAERESTRLGMMINDMITCVLVGEKGGILCEELRCAWYSDSAEQAMLQQGLSNG
jgi:hypothetical protein